MIPDIELHYSTKIAEAEQELKKLKNKLVLGSSFRLFFFLLIVFSLYHLFQSFQIGWLLFFVVSLIGFLGMISWYVNIKNKEKYQLQLNYFFQNELNQINGQANSFDDGFKFDDGAGFWSDLDLFGKGSVYHSINRTVTEYGQTALANQFKNSLLNKSSILEQQLSLIHI